MLKYIVFALFCAVICAVFLLLTNIVYGAGRKRMQRKVVEVKSLSGLLDVCDDFMTVEPEMYSQSGFQVMRYFADG